MDDRPRPIHSALGEDPSLAAAIETFVVGLAERIDELQDCEAQGTLARLAERAAALAGDATRIGYKPIAEYPGIVSATAGTSGSVGSRRSDVTASGTICAALIAAA